MDWDRLFDRRLLVVSGKGGTGKSTLAASIAWAGATRGLSVLLAEVEGRAEATRTLGVEDPGYEERETPFGFRVLSITPVPAAMEYLSLFVGFHRATRTVVRAGLVEQLVEAAPGFRDLLICGKLYEIVRLRGTDDRVRTRPRYDLVVVDGPPTGQIVALLSAPAAFAELVRMGRIRNQAARIDRMLRNRAHVLLTSLAEEMSVAETREAIPSLERIGMRVTVVAANRLLPPIFPRGTRTAATALSPDDAVRIAEGAGAKLDGAAAAELLAGALARDRRRRLQRRAVARLREVSPILEVAEAPGMEGPVLTRAIAAGIEPAVPLLRQAADRPSGVRAAPAPTPAPSLGDHLAGARIVLVCGSGGVGKTTTSAAIGVRLAEGAHRAVLLTVDPARRLATALNLPIEAGERTTVRLGRDRHLEAIQLDTQRTFDELVRRYAGNPGRRDRILGNPFYRRIANTLAGTHEYMAMEKLFELATDETHDAIVVDTPPTRSALSLLDAPRRLTDFLGGRFLRWLSWPTARAGRLSFGLARLGAETFGRTVGRLVGAETLADVAEFLGAFEGMYGGFSDRAARVFDLLRSPDCAFLVVAAPAGQSTDEAERFVSELRRQGMRAAAVVVNRWHPERTDVPSHARRALEGLARGSAQERAVAAVLADRLRREPQRIAEELAVARLSGRLSDIPIIAVPELPQDVHDVPGLRLMASALFSSDLPG